MLLSEEPEVQITKQIILRFLARDVRYVYISPFLYADTMNMSKHCTQYETTVAVASYGSLEPTILVWLWLLSLKVRFGDGDQNE